MTKKSNQIRHLLALTGSIIGITIAALLGALRFGWLSLQQSITPGPPPPAGDGIVSGVAFVLVFAVPFLLSLPALRLPTSTLQSAAWLGTSVLALFGSLASFSAVTLLTMPIPAVLLGAAGLLALHKAGLRQSLRILGTGRALVIVGLAAFFAPFVQDNPACWALIQGESGDPVWEPRPYSKTSPNLPADPGPDEPVAWTCATDTVSGLEGLMSISLEAFLIVLAGLAKRHKTFGLK